MDKESLKQKIELLFDQEFSSQGFELVDLTCRQDGAVISLRILADRLGGGINLDECARISRQISAALEQDEAALVSYVLEVSSPGLDRPLRNKKDFLRFLNKKAVFFLSEKIEGKCEWSGSISKVQGECVFIDCGTSILEIPLSKINKAVLII